MRFMKTIKFRVYARTKVKTSILVNLYKCMLINNNKKVHISYHRIQYNVTLFCFKILQILTTRCYPIQLLIHNVLTHITDSNIRILKRVHKVILHEYYRIDSSYIYDKRNGTTPLTVQNSHCSKSSELQLDTPRAFTLVP